MAVEDIKRVQEVIARESKQLVYTPFNLIVAVPTGTDLQKCTNHLEMCIRDRYLTENLKLIVKRDKLFYYDVTPTEALLFDEECEGAEGERCV